VAHIALGEQGYNAPVPEVKGKMSTTADRSELLDALARKNTWVEFYLKPRWKNRAVVTGTFGLVLDLMMVVWIFAQHFAKLGFESIIPFGLVVCFLVGFWRLSLQFLQDVEVSLRYGDVQRVEPRSTLDIALRGAGSLICVGSFATVGVAAYLLLEIFGLLKHQ
jgi:hypothetical protein